MEIDAKILNKFLANQINSTLKGSHTMSSGIYSRDAKMVQHMQINKCDI